MYFLCTAEGPSIYVKGLPQNATPAMLENEFRKFGPIRNGGIQVRSQKVDVELSNSYLFL